jgi:REP element-mobilizing transposase RayT
MPYDPDRHHRRSIRLLDYDYAQAGAYFITICVRNRECLLGDIPGGDLHLSAAGALVAELWDALPTRFPTIELDAFVVMPNHVHGILVIIDHSHESQPDVVGAGLALPENQASAVSETKGNPWVAPTLGDILGAFKSISAIACNRLLDHSGVPFWQRNYWEHVIRDEDDLARLREYIANNPGKWIEDKYHPSRPIDET